MITPNQIKAARALIDWSQQDLADQCDMSKTAIANIESGLSRPTEKNMAHIKECFDRAGVEFIDGGVRAKKDLIRVIEGEGCYLQLLDDVYQTLYKTGGELLISCSDDKVSPHQVNESYRRIRNCNISMRQLVEEGNTYIMGPLQEYRYLPKEFFYNNVMLIYGNKIAAVLENEKKITIIKDKSFTDAQRNMFNFIWSVAKQPTLTTAEEKF